MNREQYLHSASVRSFGEWLKPRLCTPGTFHHEYRIEGGTRWKCESLFNAYEQYEWAGLGFEETITLLGPLSEQLRQALEEGTTEQFLKAASDVFDWAGGPDTNNMRTLRNLGPDLIPMFREAVLQLDPSSADLDRLHRVAYMNSGFTKLYALLVDGFPIYDSRVGGALGYLVREFLVSRGEEPIPTELRFAHGGARSNKNRNPSTSRLRFPLLAGARPRTRRNLMAAWLMGSLCELGCFAEIPNDRRVWALESALFMIGYEIPRADF